MKHKKIIKNLTICLLLLLLIFGVVFLKNSEVEPTKVVSTSKNSEKETFLSVKKGHVYIRKSFDDDNDPFNRPIVDTITVLDLQTSKKSGDLIYVKWTFNCWNDTTRYLSTELKIFTHGLQELK